MKSPAMAELQNLPFAFALQLEMTFNYSEETKRKSHLSPFLSPKQICSVDFPM